MYSEKFTCDRLMFRYINDEIQVVGTCRICVLNFVASCENSVKGIFCVHNLYVTFFL